MRQTNIKTPFSTNYFLDYYTGYRDKESDLFDSEKYFLKDFLQDSKSILDIGCATGGMYNILKEKKSEINYSGIDVAENLINEAQKKFPKINFLVYDGTQLPYDDSIFDGVISFGTTVHDQDYFTLLSEAYRVTSRKLIFDIRLTNLPELNSIEDSYVIDGSKVKYPYVVANVVQFFQWAIKLKNLKKLNIYGYWGKGNKYTNLPFEYKKICMAGVLLEKRTSKKSKINNPEVRLKVPKKLLTDDYFKTVSF